MEEHPVTNKSEFNFIVIMSDFKAPCENLLIKCKHYCLLKFMDNLNSKYTSRDSHTKMATYNHHSSIITVLYILQFVTQLFNLRSYCFKKYKWYNMLNTCPKQNYKERINQIKYWIKNI